MKELISTYIDAHFNIKIEWNTQKDSFECFLFSIKKKTKKKLSSEVSDQLVDLILDNFDLLSNEGEYSVGSAYISKKEDAYVMHYEIDYKKRYEQSKTIILDNLIHPEEINTYFNRSHLHFSVSYNHLKFIRIDIKPLIFEGDAYTLKTNLLEKYRNYFTNKIKELYETTPKTENGVEYKISIESIVKSLKNNEFTQNLVWFVFEKKSGELILDPLKLIHSN